MVAAFIVQKSSQGLVLKIKEFLLVRDVQQDLFTIRFQLEIFPIFVHALCFLSDFHSSSGIDFFIYLQRVSWFLLVLEFSDSASGVTIGNSASNNESALDGTTADRAITTDVENACTDVGNTCTNDIVVVNSTSGGESSTAEGIVDCANPLVSSSGHIIAIGCENLDDITIKSPTEGTSDAMVDKSVAPDYDMGIQPSITTITDVVDGGLASSA
ncbi:hypothetical protein Dimus_033407, partial [Dionaea muscipula]